MHHIRFKENDKYDAAILIKKSSLNKQDIQEYYLDKLDPNLNIIAFSLDYNEHNKSPAKLMNTCIDETLKVIKSLGISILYVADSNYFKKLTKNTKIEFQYGNVNRCEINDYSDINIILGVNYKSISFNPSMQPKLDLSLNTLTKALTGIVPELGKGIIHSARYPTTTVSIQQELDKLYKYPVLSIDVETYGLTIPFTLATISFAWDQHNGLAFTVYKGNTYRYAEITGELIKKFLTEYKGKLIFHGATFDIKVLIYTLWYKKEKSTTELLKGLEILTRNIEDTLLITYLATNNTRGNHLGLKEQSYEFAGDYGIDVKNNRLIETPELLEYNLKDTLCTWYVYNKYYEQMVNDNQLEVYRNIFIPSVKLFIQIEVNGMPMQKSSIKKLDTDLMYKHVEIMSSIRNNSLIQSFVKELKARAVVKKNLLLIKKVVDIYAFGGLDFNPNSGKQVGDLLHDYLGLPIIDKTPTGLPKTSAKTLKKVLIATHDKPIKELIQALIDNAELSTIKDTFIPAFNNAIDHGDGRRYLHGSYHLGGTVSGRLSSSKPCMMNLPSTGTKYAKPVKKCFVAPGANSSDTGWLMGGVDFDSLEDKVSALTTKDPNKLKVYEQGYDGHCLRAYSYFKEEMPDIEMTVESINSIKDKYPEIRQRSKEPTFLLTYRGTHYGLMTNTGMDKSSALHVEQNYHDLYQVSDMWIDERIEEATWNGYVTGAFGLRLRTPILSQVILNKKNTPYEARKEARTAGNMLGQSYGMLNNRAGIEFQERVLASKYREDIKPIAHIHDSQYFIFRDNIDVVHWINKNLIECIEWQELPELQHDTVKLSGQFFINYPDWSHEIKIPNGASKAQIREVCNGANS